MGILIIDDDAMRAIAEAVQRAKARPLPLSIVESFAIASDVSKLAIGDFDPRGQSVRDRYPVQNIMLGTYRIAFSYEEQPHGFVRHISVSSDKANKGQIPNEHAMRMIVEAFGYSGFPPKGPSHIWSEEYEPGKWAINVIELDEEYGKSKEPSVSRSENA